MTFSGASPKLTVRVKYLAGATSSAMPQ